MKVIKGNIRPKAEEKTFYELTSLIHDFSSPILNNKPKEVYVWTLFKKDQKIGWKQVSNNIKYGEKVPYTFGERVVEISYKIEVHAAIKNLLGGIEQKLVASLVVTPRTAKEPIIGRVILLNRSNSDVNKAKFNESLSAEARTSNLLGKEITFYLWEEGASEADKYQKPKKGTVDKNGIAKVTFNLSEYASPQTFMSFFTNNKSTKKFFVSAVYEDKKATNKAPVVASDGTEQSVSNNTGGIYDMIGRAAGVTAELIAEGFENLGKVFEENTITATVVGQRESIDTNTNECQRCKKLTEEEVDKIFTSASEDNKKALLAAFNDGNLKFEINTCLRKAHFFAQVLEEVGTNLKLSEPESFNYSARRLKNGDFTKGTGWVKDLVNGGHYASGTWTVTPFEYFKTHHNEANLYGRKDLNSYNDRGIQAANSKEIANCVYADRNRDPKYRLGNTQDGDGWRFMGKGIIQVTGRTNYTEVNKRLEKKGYNFDIVNNPDNVLKHKESVLSSMAFWYWKDLQLKSDKGGKEIVDSITKIVNEGTPTYSERRENFDKTYSVFQVDKCSPVKKEEEPKANGKWRMPIDNPMLCMYSQGGGYKPWHGSFGEKIRDGSVNHTGNDLLAVPGTKVYACLKSKVHKIYTSTSMAGNVVVLKVLDVETFKSLKRNYTPLYRNKGEILERGFDENGVIYLTFWHLSKNNFFKEGDIVEHNSIIGLTGVSGWSGKHFTTRNPHLHFEVSNVGSAPGLSGKCNPSVYFKFKTEDELSKAEIEYQNKLKEKEWN